MTTIRQSLPASRPAAPQGGTAAVPAAPAPQSPAGGASGAFTLDGLRLSGGAASGTPALGPAAPLGSTPASQRAAMKSIFANGVSRDLAGKNQQTALDSALDQLQDGQIAAIAGLLSQAGSQTEQHFILKALIAGESWDAVTGYANEMRGLPESEVVSRSTMRDDHDVIQQWQDACGPTLVQTAAGEADPRYAWELNKVGDLSAIDPEGANATLAAQQKQWLEAYGGVAVERGASGGQGIALTQMLNDTLSSVTGATYQTTEVKNAATALDAIQGKLDAGYDVPLRLAWDPQGASGHFLLAMAARGQRGNRELEIHDPWTGRTAWVSEKSIAADHFEPLFTGYAKLTHYYDPQA